jgi:hypothetical protein
MFEQYQGPIRPLFECKEATKYEKKKFTHVRSHDCHVLVTQLLPVALRGVLPDNVRATIIKLCAFLNAISQKAIDPTSLRKLLEDVVQMYI